MNRIFGIIIIFVLITVSFQTGLAQEKPRVEIVLVDMPKDITVRQSIYVDVVVKNAGGDAKAGGISISFPDNPLLSIIHSDTTNTTIYPPGSQIWSNVERKNIAAEYVLVEAWQEPWQSQEEHRFKLKVMPNLAGKLRVYVRATVTVPAQKREIIKTPDSSTITDQQGFPVLSYEVKVIDMAATSIQVVINQIDASYYPDVICYVAVADEADRPIPGLTKDNFFVSEDGVIQNIKSVSFSGLDSEGQSVPITAALTIDNSSSMNEEGKMTSAISAAVKFIDLMLPDDKAIIVGFSDHVNVYGNLSSSKQYLKSLVKSMAMGKRKALYDAVAISADEVLKEQGRKAVITLTDGSENQSRVKYDKIEKLKDTGIPIYMIALGDRINENSMRQIVWNTGGRYYHVPNSADLVNLYSSISRQLHQIYLVKYTTSSDFLGGKTVRDVMVRVKYKGMSGQDIKEYRNY